MVEIKKDYWANVVRLLISDAIALVTVDGKYHGACFVKFPAQVSEVLIKAPPRSSSVPYSLENQFIFTDTLDNADHNVPDN
ncbi:hypothetical protein AVEN_81591-1 [Araneus ventricosus]|uniref:Uncharacterized protein n=1 Tax=Araneus ventricosus TaxID=182803 RepID=A0A4Y2FMS1_ARAVE|nr:hypothetical protein AVEN_81591-1 [Araneus ventricosus]